ncbi:Uncharacterised protein [Yersinia massiliensis]|uniref:hypothetical protein n=1 Tax=Yersinia massiliensis TaxID=419257 RepID=UPI0005DAD217|nr:hypothetical protein [Yersinia massiliensis]CNH78274.1 Uncharacterised protein [Yersinia massiliensis]
MKDKKNRRNARKLQMLAQLQKLCLARMKTTDLLHIPPPERWPKTRELAELCDENIYAARTLLLALEVEGKIYCTYRSINNSLRWFIRFK